MVEAKTQYLSEGEITAKTEKWNKIIENGSPISYYDLYCLIRDIIRLREDKHSSTIETPDYSFTLGSTRLEEEDTLIADSPKKSSISVLSEKRGILEIYTFTQLTQLDLNKSLLPPNPERIVNYNSAFGFKAWTVYDKVELIISEKKQMAKTIWQAHLVDRAPMTETK